MKALIAVDGSSGGSEAARQAARLLSPEKDRVALYYSPPGFHLDSSSAIQPGVLEGARKALATAVFEEACSHLPDGLRQSVHAIVGAHHARDGIIAAANIWQADLIVVGARGLGPIKKLLVGSTSTSVVRSAMVPVLVARAPVRSADAGLRVLVACDGSQAGRHLADLVRKLSWPSGSVGNTITVVESLFAGQIPAWLEEKAKEPGVEQLARAWVEEHESQLAARHTEMEDYCGNLPDPFHAGRRLVVEGHPADQILMAIAQEYIDLVILGARHATRLKRLFMGSTSETVLSHSPCSVLVVPDQAEP